MFVLTRTSFLCLFFVFQVHVLVCFFALANVGTSAVDCLERLVSKLTYYQYVMSGR